LGEKLAAILGLPFLCLDALFHQPHWQHTPPDIFQQQVKEFIASNPNGWIIDGNYRKVVGDITWKASTDIIWLDYPIFVILWRLWFRTIGRIRSGVKLWGKDGCVETWKSQFFSWDSLLYVLLISQLIQVYRRFGFIGIVDQHFMRN
jgi:adenylate kinase family enzyme